MLNVSILDRSAAAPAIPCLAMRLPQASRAIGVSPRTLWEWTQHGGVPHVRRGKTILYPVDALRHWLDEQSHRTQLNTTTQGGDINVNGTL